MMAQICNTCKHKNNSRCYCSPNSVCEFYEEECKENNLDDGIYIELFAVKDGVRYNAKVISIEEVSTILTNSLMDGIKKLW